MLKTGGGLSPLVMVKVSNLLARVHYPNRSSENGASGISVLWDSRPTKSAGEGDRSPGLSKCACMRGKKPKFRDVSEFITPSKSNIGREALLVCHCCWLPVSLRLVLSV